MYKAHQNTDPEELKNILQDLNRQIQHTDNSILLAKLEHQRNHILEELERLKEWEEDTDQLVTNFSI